MKTTIDQNSVSADEIVTEVMSDTYDENSAIKEKYYRWLFRVWTSLNFDFIRTERRVIIPVSLSTMTLRLPVDYLDLIFFGYYDGCGNLLPIHINRNLAPALDTVDDLTQLCPCCGAKDLCKVISQQQTTEEIPATAIINFGTADFVTDSTGKIIYKTDTFYKIISREIYPDGSYVEMTDQPSASYNADGTFRQIITLSDKKILCQLEKGCADCVPCTAGNLQMLQSCCCDQAICCATDLLPHQVISGVGHFNLIEQEHYIQLSPNSSIRKAFLKYVSAGVCKNGIYIFPLVSMDALIEGTYYLSIAKKKNVPLGEKERARISYRTAKKELLRRMTRLSYMEWLELIDMIPRIPAL